MSRTDSQDYRPDRCGKYKAAGRCSPDVGLDPAAMQRRCLGLCRWLTELKATTDGLGAIYFEEVRRHAGVDAAHAYGGFLATLTSWCEHYQIPYAGVPVGTIKKHATGRGNADKAAMVTAVRALGHQPADDNEAGAIALLRWAIGQCHDQVPSLAQPAD